MINQTRIPLANAEYSVPEQLKQEYTDSGIIVSQHRALPHLVKRRQYVSERVDSSGQTDKELPSTSPQTFSDQKTWPSNSPEHTAQTESKQRSTLELDSMPRPNVVSGENTVQGVRCNAKVQVTYVIPCPNATTRHYTPDEGNSIYRMLRVTSQCILMDGSSFFNSSSLPFGAIAQPFADLSEYETPVPLSKYGEAKLIRCKRCGAYVNPGFAFMHNGVEFRCNICEGISPSSTPIFGTNEGRPELTLGTYDFIAPEALKGKQMKGNNLLFIIEATQNSINFGNLKEELRIDTSSNSFNKISFRLYSRFREHEHRNNNL